jgi:hypothetical protein
MNVPPDPRYLLLELQDLFVTSNYSGPDTAFFDDFPFVDSIGPEIQIDDEVDWLMSLHAIRLVEQLIVLHFEGFFRYFEAARGIKSVGKLHMKHD